MSLSEIRSAVSQLQEDERGDLVSWILDTLPSHSSEDAYSDSLAIANERLKELDSGEADTISHEDFITAYKKHRKG